MTPAEAMQQVTAAYDCTPYEINNGCCEDWAYDVEGELYDGPNHVEVWETLFGISDTNHVFLRIDGKFYDAECPEGVEDHNQLPIFARIGKRQPVWLVDHNGHFPEGGEDRRDVTAEQVAQYNADNGTNN